MVWWIENFDLKIYFSENALFLHKNKAFLLKYTEGSVRPSKWATFRRGVCHSFLKKKINYINPLKINRNDRKRQLSITHRETRPI